MALLAAQQSSSSPRWGFHPSVEEVPWNLTQKVPCNWHKIEAGWKFMVLCLLGSSLSVPRKALTLHLSACCIIHFTSVTQWERQGAMQQTRCPIFWLFKLLLVWLSRDCQACTVLGWNNFSPVLQGGSSHRWDFLRTWILCHVLFLQQLHRTAECSLVS